MSNLPVTVQVRRRVYSVSRNGTVYIENLIEGSLQSFIASLLPEEVIRVTFADGGQVSAPASNFDVAHFE